MNYLIDKPKSVGFFFFLELLLVYEWLVRLAASVDPKLKVIEQSDSWTFILHSLTIVISLHVTEYQGSDIVSINEFTLIPL